jgi:hypothetical protein
MDVFLRHLRIKSSQGPGLLAAGQWENFGGELLQNCYPTFPPRPNPLSHMSMQLQTRKSSCQGSMSNSRQTEIIQQKKKKMKGKT